MRWTMVVAMVTLGCMAGWEEEGKERAFKFSKDDVGKVPKGWKAEQTGKGEGSIWKVVADDTAPSKSGLALAQTAEGPNALFNLCVSDEPSLEDVEIMVSFKAVQGKNDQGGGVVWRY